MSSSAQWDDGQRVVSLCAVPCGRRVSAPLAAVGVCVADSSGTIHETGQINFDVRWPAVSGDTLVYGDFEPYTWDCLWKGRSPAELSGLQVDPVSHRAGFELLASLVDGWQTAAVPPIFLAERIEFDVAWINVGLETHVGRLPISFCRNGDWCDIIQFDFGLCSLPASERALVCTAEEWSASVRDPAQRAMYMCGMYAAEFGIGSSPARRGS